MAAIGASSINDRLVQSVIDKRLQALCKKYNWILRIEESLSLGKTLNSDQEETLRSKASVIGCISELEKLQPLVCTAVEKEFKELEVNKKFSMIEDMINLLYFGMMFTLPQKYDFGVTESERLHERERCLAYTYVKDSNVLEFVRDMDLTLISVLGNLITSKPINSSLSHQNALHLCFEHARLLFAKSDHAIGSDPDVTYSGLRDKQNKIMASDYFTRTPEIKVPIEVVAAAGGYGSFQVTTHESMVPVHMEIYMVQYPQKEDEIANAEKNDSYDKQSSPLEEFHQGDETKNLSELLGKNKPVMYQARHNLQKHDIREHQYVPQRSFQNYRGGHGVGASGHRGYTNVRGESGSGRAGVYQNGRNQHYDHAGTYYPREQIPPKKRRGRGLGGNYYYPAAQAEYVVIDS